MSWIPVSCSGSRRPRRRDSWIESVTHQYSI